MTDTESTTATDAPEGLQPLSNMLNLLGGDAAGFCSGGVCHIPAPSEKKNAE